MNKFLLMSFNFESLGVIPLLHRAILIASISAN